MRLTVTITALLLAALALYLAVDFDGFAQWAAQEQRGFQNRMATAVRALQSGDTSALVALFMAAAAYGFFHAVGPGHGKALIGGVGLRSSVSVSRLLAISLISSLAQALWAIVLVYGGFSLLELSARRMTDLAENLLAPASYLAITLIGVVLIWRGVRALKRSLQSRPSDHDHDHCGCHSHGPSAEEVEKLTSWRDTVALVASIAIRPCTGAVFLLVIAWQMDLRGAGAAAVVVMGLGTAAFTSLVAVSSIAARTMTLVSADRLHVVSHIVPSLLILSGLLVIWISLTLLGYAL